MTREGGALMNRRRSVAFALMLVVTLTAGCSAWTYTKSLFVTGISIETVGEQFANTSEIITNGCIAQVITKETCAAWRTFSAHFKKTYPLAAEAWKSGRRVGDAALQGAAEDAVRKLAAELSRLGVEALSTFAPEVPR